jgi:tRNA threonylcarbamoyl adenosine modification protein (Sua5/YciO/YrdC/YwlC family)
MAALVSLAPAHTKRTKRDIVSQFYQIHPENPQARLIRTAVNIIRNGGVVVYPTDSAYALGCHIGDKTALDRIRRIRRLDDKHNFTLVCRDLSEIATYAKVNNTSYRLLRHTTPGPYTFILQATNEVPRRLMHPKRKTVGLRVPDNAIAAALLADLGEPLMSVTLIMPGDEFPLTDPYDIRATLEHEVDLVIDGGYCGMEPSTVVDLADDRPMILRAGKGDVTPFER